MQYIPVTGLNPVGAVKNIIINHFGAALISIAEPTTSRAWTIHQVFKQVNKIFKYFNEATDPMLKTLLLDSGGFQILMGYIQNNRIREYTDTYHFLLEKFHSNFENENIKTLIFSLDILNKNMSKEEVFKFNKYSIESSISLFEKYPKLRDKQLFIIQSRFPETLEIWKTIIKDNKVFDNYHRYSFGGLVGLKKETNAKFNHFVPMLFWTLIYAKSLGKDVSKENMFMRQMHMLGQSSRLAIITAVILEELTGVSITMDSSEVLRFSPIEAKLPLIYKNGDNFEMARDTDHLAIMLKNNSCHKDDNYSLDEALEYLKKSGKVSNPDFVGTVCQGIESTLDFANMIKEDLKDKINDRTLLNWNVDDFQQYHSIFKQGRLAQELVNNLQHAKTGILFLDKEASENNFEDYHKITKDIIEDYYK